MDSSERRRSDKMSETQIWTKVTAVFAEEPEEWSNWVVVFENHGILGTVQTDDPPAMSAYLAPGAEDQFESLKQDLLTRGAFDVLCEDVPEETWAESWKQFFKPVRIGKKFVIRPTWEPYELNSDDIEIVLDPGQAFGTGDHPTTRMCLELLERCREENWSPFHKVADIGCGSGILTIACKQLGAEEVVAVDTDPVSVEATVENCERNQVQSEVRVGKGFDPLPESAKFNIVVSNIISAALIALSPEASQRVLTNGIWIVSGIIDSNWDDVKTKAELVGFQLIEKRQEIEWVAAAFRR